MIFEVTTVIVLGCHKLHLYKITNLTNECVCSDRLVDQAFPIALPSPWVLPYFPILKLS